MLVSPWEVRVSKPWGLPESFCGSPPKSREGGISGHCCWADILLSPISIEGEYVPVEGDEVTYKMCPIPPKNQKFQAVEVVLTQLAPHTPHETWSGQVVGS